MRPRRPCSPVTLTARRHRVLSWLAVVLCECALGYVGGAMLLEALKGWVNQ